ncbi:GNAT family N-acetyltransferase [Polymorphobacter fuscus]|nr:GNAT family N-acetyltransferase [Polymorphobacter fuscus]NJC08277.1 phosphinothricin acetyltransferase [Polymorphobacter fuscus]
MIRPALPGDAAAIAAIYAPEVLGGTATFEIDAPDATEIARRMARVAAAGWPWLVHEDAGAIGGFAYASQFRDRPAYAHSCETSVYIAPALQRRGAGRALMAALVTSAADAGFRQMIAVIGDSGNAASIGLHRACGFAEVGRLTDVGHKFGRWLDVVYMQRGIGA